MQIILREDVEHLGIIGDVIHVKDGYARNFLLPRGFAAVANARQLRRVEHEKQLIEHRIAKQRKGAEGIKADLDRVALTVEKAVGENEKLFGSVTSMELEALLRGEGFEVSRKHIMLSDNIKTTGVFRIDVKLHRDVTATFTLTVIGKA